MSSMPLQPWPWWNYWKMDSIKIYFMFHLPTTGLSVVIISPVIRPSSYSWLSPPGMPWKAGFVGKGWQLWVCRWNPFQPQTPLSSSSVTPHRVQSPSIFPLLPLLYTDVAYISNTRGSCPAGLSLCSPAQLLSERTGGLWGEMGGRGFFQFLVFHIWTIIDETKQMVAEYTQQNPGREFTKFIFEWNIVHWKVVLY